MAVCCMRPPNCRESLQRRNLPSFCGAPFSRAPRCRSSLAELPRRLRAVPAAATSAVSTPVKGAVRMCQIQAATLGQFGCMWFGQVSNKTSKRVALTRLRFRWLCISFTSNIHLKATWEWRINSLHKVSILLDHPRVALDFRCKFSFR